MNKELIKQYKAEFDHWLNGGKLLFRPMGKQIWFNSTSSPTDWAVEAVYIINDEYVEFRKALAEGKTIQVRRHINGIETHTISNVTDMLNYAVSDVSIKLDEHLFKVGDWIQFSTTKLLLGKIAGFSSTNVPYCLSGRDKITPNTLELELWTPKPNEWCVFWRTDMTEYLVSTFNYRRDCGAYITDYGHEFYNVAPLEFINTLKE